jgi:signal transduction histidine kinase
LLFEDRDRIARDLHDVVIQRLFDTGLTLDSVAPLVGDAGVRERLAAAVDELDTTIRDIRSTIFALERTRPEASLRHRLLEVASSQADNLGFTPRLHFNGEIDSRVPHELDDDLAAVLNEALSNVVRHAEARSVDVTVEVDAERVRIMVADDGAGLPIEVERLERRSGLANLAKRAVERGGAFTVQPRDGGGTVVMWTAPLAR